jgi:hypothetical protein
MDASYAVQEWMNYDNYDPQGRILELFQRLGHQRGEWRYTGMEGPWSQTGMQCTHCGAWAHYGCRSLGERWSGSHGRKLAIWGDALLAACTPEARFFVDKREDPDRPTVFIPKASEIANDTDDDELGKAAVPGNDAPASA